MTIWENPSDLGLYCEKQQQAHCGAHAWQALLGRKLLTHPTQFYQHLKTSLQHARTSGIAAEACAAEDFTPNGWYGIHAIQHYMYEHCLDNVALVLVADLTHQENRYCQVTEEQLMAKAPIGCKSLLIYTQVKDTNTHKASATPHWITRMCVSNVWYECDSIAFSREGKVQATDPCRLGADLAQHHDL